MLKASSRNFRPTLGSCAALPQRHLCAAPVPLDAGDRKSGVVRTKAHTGEHYSSAGSLRSVDAPGLTASASGHAGHSALEDGGALAPPGDPGRPSTLSLTDLVGKSATVRFHLTYRTTFGQTVKLVGSHPSLGNWSLRDAVDLRWQAGDVWVAMVPLPAGFVYEYKYVVVDYASKQALEWQSGSNAVLAVVVNDTDVSVHDNWGNAPGAMVQVDEERMTRESKLQKWAGEMVGYWHESRRLQLELVHQGHQAQGLRNEVAQLRMELSLERAAKSRAEQQVSELAVANSNLRTTLVRKTMDFNNTLAEVLQLLDKELEDCDEDPEEGLYQHDDDADDQDDEQVDQEEEKEEEQKDDGEDDQVEAEQERELVLASPNGRPQVSGVWA